MPLSVDIKINGEFLERIHIGRYRGQGMQEDDVNEYRAVLSPKRFSPEVGREVFTDTPTWIEWEEGAPFEHRYGDGAVVCVEKALEALKLHGS